MKTIPNQRTSGHKARKRFGQNFLVNEQVIQSIINVIGAKPGEQIVEIGPGLGALTTRLLDSGAEVTAVELDRDLADKLTQQFSAVTNFELINADALKIDFSSLGNLESSAKLSQKLRVIGNLPYNISTPLLFKMLESAEHIQDMHFMLQREVVNRLAASPGTSDWGRLSIMIQYHCDVEPLIDVPPDSFDPPPKVNSAVVKLTPKKPDNIAKDIKLLENIVRTAFNMRRKTLRNALKSLASAKQMEEIGIDPTARPENLSLDQYIMLSNSIVLK